MALQRRRRFLVFGNPLVKEDSLPLCLMDGLVKAFPSIDFISFDPNENMEEEGRDLDIIDTVKGIDKVVLIKDLDSLKLHKVYSMHDFDLGYNLKLLMKLKYVDSVRVFGVPMKMSKKTALEQLTLLISANSP